MSPPRYLLDVVGSLFSGGFMYILVAKVSWSGGTQQLYITVPGFTTMALANGEGNKLQDAFYTHDTTVSYTVLHVA
jgi:hypothetical protein